MPVAAALLAATPAAALTPSDSMAPPLPADALQGRSVPSAMAPGLPSPLDIPAAPASPLLPLPPSASGFTTVGGFAAPAAEQATAQPAAQAASLGRAIPPEALARDRFRLDFSAGSEALDADAASLLDGLAARLLARPHERLELNAYAPAGEYGEGAARRLSLARALAVRQALLRQGVPKSRLIVFAHGSRAPEAAAAPDRVDLAIRP